MRGRCILAQSGDIRDLTVRAAADIFLVHGWERDVADGLGELSFPPEFPKMPGEPPRVQPSKKVAAHWDADGEPTAKD